MTWNLLAEFGLTWACQSSALLALGLCAGGLLRRQGAAVQSAAYRTTLLAVLVCPFASTLLAGAGLDGVTFHLPAARAEVATAPLTVAKADPIVEAAPKATPVPPRRSIEPSATVVTLGPVAALPPSYSSSTPIQAPAPPRDWLAVGVSAGLTAWVLGSMFLGLRLAVGVRAMTRLRGSAIPAGADEEALCVDLARRMKLAPPAVLRSPFLHSPCVEGLRRPAILLPDDPGVDLRDTFVHELAHLARRDVWWNLLRQSASALLWFQPLLWVLSRRMEVTAEEVCDDYVVQFGADRASYAGLLVELARRTLPPVAPTALGMVSLRSLLARRVVRILDASRSPSTRAGRRAVFLMLVAGLAGTSLAGLLGVGSPRRQALAQALTKPAKKTDGLIRGQVVDPDGKPVVGALVVASWAQFQPDGVGTEFFAKRRHEFTTRTAGPDGRFEVPGDSKRSSVIAKAPGFGPGYLREDGTIPLTAGDRPINGRLVDLEGRPVAGASIKVLQLFTIPDPKDRQVAESRPGPYQFPYDKSLGLDGEGTVPGGVVTDADGRFRVEGLGIDALASLRISGPTIAMKEIKVMTRAMRRVTRDDTRESNSMGLEEPGIHGADCTIVVQQGRPIEGVVRDLETGEPIPGAIVTAAQVGGQNLIIEGKITAETDAEGRYRLLGLPVGQGHKVSVYPPLDRPYFITRQREVPSRAGLGAVPFDITLRRGAWITGRVADLKTGQALKASVDYFPFLDNPHAKDYPNFIDSGGGSIEVKTRYRTDADGRFRVVGLPGRGVVTARSDDGTYLTGFGSETIAGKDEVGHLPTFDRITPTIYQAIREVVVPTNREPAVVDLPLDPGGSVVLKFVDEAGRPIEQVVAYGLAPVGADSGDHNVYDHATSAKVGGLVPGKPRTVVLKQADRKLGAVVELPIDGPRDGRELSVVLRPFATVVGRVVADRPLPPRAGVEVVTFQAGTPRGWSDEINIDSETLEPDGRFRIAVLPPGGRFLVRAKDRPNNHMGGKLPDGFEEFELTVNFKPEAGEVVDLGTFDARTGKQVEAPAAKKPEAADVPITGRIVDLEARPVAGVTVTTGNYRTPTGTDLTPWLEGARQGQSPMAMNHLTEWHNEVPNTVKGQATTDLDGRFRIEGLGAERVVSLKLAGETIAQTSIDVATRKMEPITAMGFHNPNGSGARTIYGADFTFIAAPGRAAEGVVKDASTGQPLAGAEVRSYRFAGSDFIGTMTLMTKADDQGRFRLTGFPKGKGNQLLIVPTDEQPYPMQEVNLPDTPGTAPIVVEASMKRGIWIEGKITEQGTGQPVANARMNYMPFLENTFALAHPAFDRNGNTDGSGFQARYLSKDDGSFRLVGLPGRAIVGALAVDAPYVQGVGSEAIERMDKNGHFATFYNPINPSKLWPTVMKEINPSANAETVHVDLQVRTGPSVRLKVVDSDGQPLAGASTRGLMERSSHERQVMASAEGEARNLMPGEERQVLVRHDGRKLGKVVTVRQGDDTKGPVIVKLEPLASMTGRVVDADGHPVRGALIDSNVLPSGDFSLRLEKVSTDGDGKFRFPGLPTGCEYSLSIDSNTPAIRNRQYAFVEKAAVKPGEATDVGVVKFDKD